MDLLVKNHANVDASQFSDDYMTPLLLGNYAILFFVEIKLSLFKAAETNDIKSISILVMADANVNAGNPDWYTALMFGKYQ